MDLRLACGDLPATIPENYLPAAEAGNWREFRAVLGDDLMVVTHGEEDQGIIAVFPKCRQSPKMLLESVTKANPVAKLPKRFVFPDSRRVTEYEVNAPKMKGVIVSDAERATERDFRKWPLARITVPFSAFPEETKRKGEYSSING